MDLIERQTVIEEIAYSIELCNKALDSMTLGGRDRYAVEVERNSLLKLKDDFKLLPSAQPEIIRCKDCKFWKKYGYINGKPEFLPKCGFNQIYTSKDDFCSRAERENNG